MTNEVHGLGSVIHTAQPLRAVEARSVAHSESGQQVPPNGKVQPQPKASEHSEVLRAVEKLANHARSVGRDLQFEIDSDSGKTLIKVIDPETEEIVRQIPSEEAVERARSSDSDAMNLVDDLT